jgi:biopolymer transport protein ExbD
MSGSPFGGKKGAFGGGSDMPADVSLNLTALMDILSNLLFFLLASYSAPSEVAPKGDMTLPSSSTQVTTSKELTVTLTKKELFLADVPVAQVMNGKIGNGDENEKIPALLERLQNVKASRAAAGQDDLPGQDTVLVLADKESDATQVARVLKTAASAGFVKARFGVVGQ